MSMNVDSLHYPALPRQTRLTPRRHVRITGENLAKADREPYELGHLAGLWVLESLTIAPTVALAARVFGVSVPTERAAVARLKATTIAAPTIDAVWANMSSAERDRFVRKNLAQLWDLIDRATR